MATFQCWCEQSVPPFSVVWLDDVMNPMALSDPILVVTRGAVAQRHFLGSPQIAYGSHVPFGFGSPTEPSFPMGFYPSNFCLYALTNGVANIPAKTVFAAEQVMWGIHWLRYDETQDTVGRPKANPDHRWFYARDDTWYLGSQGSLLIDVSEWVKGAAGVNEQQIVYHTQDNIRLGSFTLSFGGQTTASLQYNVSAATMQAALEALSTIGAGNVSVTGGPVADPPYAWIVEFIGTLAETDVALLTVKSPDMEVSSGKEAFNQSTDQLSHRIHGVLFRRIGRADTIQKCVPVIMAISNFVVDDSLRSQ